MRKFIVTALLCAMAYPAMAFDLQRLSAGAIAGIDIAAPAPGAPERVADSVAAAGAYKELERYFLNTHLPSDWEMDGEWEGRVLVPAGDGVTARKMSVSFRIIVTPSELGPLFQADTRELVGRFPLSEAGKVAIVVEGAVFGFNYEGAGHTAVFRVLENGANRVLMMKTDCGFGGNPTRPVYAYFMKKVQAAG